jgi:hypothetical protein
MKENLTKTQVQENIDSTEKILFDSDVRALRFWDRVKIPPALWKQSQYPNENLFWVVAVLGERCLYFNSVEEGWGWGKYKNWGTVEFYHYDQDEIHHAIFQTLFGIDNGGNG